MTLSARSLPPMLAYLASQAQASPDRERSRLAAEVRVAMAKAVSPTPTPSMPSEGLRQQLAVAHGRNAYKLARMLLLLLEPKSSIVLTSRQLADVYLLLAHAFDACARDAIGPWDHLLTSAALGLSRDVSIDQAARARYLDYARCRTNG